MIIPTLIAILVLLTLSGLFSGSETALTAASRARMHQLEKDGDPRAAKVNHLIADREGLIGAILLGNNLVNILASALATSLFIHLFGASGVAIATAVMTALVLIFAEVMPKTLAISRADKMAMTVASPMNALVKSTRWIVRGIQTVVNITLRLFGVKITNDAISADEELRGTINLHHSEGSVDEAHARRLTGALDLEDMTVEEVMIHRKNLTVLDADMPTAELIMAALASPHTRLPLYQGDKDEIIGILHAKDLLRAIAPLKGELGQADLKAILREPWFVPETTPLQGQLDAFLRKRTHFALVIDEYGALQGLVTLEDIIEEIVGDIRDEHDIPVQGVRPQADGSVNIDGWVTVRDLNRARGWSMPDEEAVTVAGLVIHEAQTIPEPGQCFTFYGYRFDILHKNRNQLTALKVTPEEDSTGK